MKKNVAYSILIMISFLVVHTLIPNNLIITKVVIGLILVILATINLYFSNKQKLISKKRLLVAIPFVIFTISYAFYSYYKI
jgi:hypothetical protein